jgi:hypothetical protein
VVYRPWILAVALVASACEDGGALPPDTASGSDTDPSGSASDAGTSGASMTSAGSDASAGSTGDASTTGANTSTTGADTAGLDEVEAACEADCEAQFATECAPGNQNVLTCKLQCATITVQLGNFCLDEYTAVVQCRADGGYDCVNGFPTPKVTCAAEQVAFSECSVDLGCKRYCDGAIAAGCGGASFDACLDGCLAERAALPERCGLYFDGLPLCEAQAGIECVDGQPATTGDCGYAVANIADCIADETDDLCQGYCYLADGLACGTNCPADCASRLADPTCGQQFDNLVECMLRYGYVECVDGMLTGVQLCDSETAAYDTCMAGG